MHFFNLCKVITFYQFNAGIMTTFIKLLHLLHGNNQS